MPFSEKGKKTGEMYLEKTSHWSRLRLYRWILSVVWTVWTLYWPQQIKSESSLAAKAAPPTPRGIGAPKRHDLVDEFKISTEESTFSRW